MLRAQDSKLLLAFPCGQTLGGRHLNRSETHPLMLGAGPNPERDRWNRRFADGGRTSDIPDTFFVEAFQEYVDPLLGSGESKSALDVACGGGRHGLWLAERGWNVTLVDLSDQALEIARRRAGGRNLAVEFVHRDLSLLPTVESARWAQKFDVISVFYYLQRDLFPVLADALQPGGLLLYKTYTDRQPQFGSGPTNPEHLLRAGELREAFPNLTVLFYRETVRERGIAELVARK